MFKKMLLYVYSHVNSTIYCVLPSVDGSTIILGRDFGFLKSERELYIEEHLFCDACNASQMHGWMWTPNLGTLQFYLGNNAVVMPWQD